MLVQFSVSNWMSFAHKTEFNMIASSHLNHGKRIPVVEKYNTKILPIAAMYGGNASGKTNFVRALSFAKEFVVNFRQPYTLIPVKPFLLDANDIDENPTSFCFLLLINETMYEFSFSVTQKRVVEEKLIQIDKSVETLLYHRKIGMLELHDSLAENKEYAQHPLKYVFSVTRNNELFLTNSIFYRLDAFRPVYDWFKDNLVLLTADSGFDVLRNFLAEEEGNLERVNNLLNNLDTGITSIGPYGPRDKSGNREIVTYHSKEGCKAVRFKMEQESYGAKRIIGLLPVFLDLDSINSKKVYVIDELDRNLHTNLLRHLLSNYLNNCSPESRCQLLFTAHDVLLMDQDMFRIDEIWLCKRNGISGTSDLVSLSDFRAINPNTDIGKMYLQGRFGATPFIFTTKW